jgi:hypothetical protein
MAVSTIKVRVRVRGLRAIHTLEELIRLIIRLAGNRRWTYRPAVWLINALIRLTRIYVQVEMHKPAWYQLRRRLRQWHALPLPLKAELLPGESLAVQGLEDKAESEPADAS